MSGSTNRHRDVVLRAANVFRDACESNLVTGPEVHVAVTGNQYWPATLSEKLLTVCQSEGHARVFAPSEHSAAMINDIVSCPVKEQTSRGAVPYRALEPLQTASGGRVVQEPSKSQPRVEFIADEGTELAWEDETVQVPFSDDDARAQFVDLPAGVFIARPEDGDGDNWVIEDDAGEEIARAATTDALDDKYVAVWDWFQPDRITFESDVTIHYPDPDNEENLVTYRKQPPQNDETEPLTTFIEQTTIQSEGAQLPKAEVFLRYQAWQSGFTNEPTSGPEFAAQLSHHGNIEWISDDTGGHSKVLNGRIWRWTPVVNR